MSFSKVTLQIMTRLQRWRAAGDPDADRKLAEHIEAALGNQPLPSYSDGKPTARAEAPMVLDRRTVDRGVLAPRLPQNRGGAVIGRGGRERGLVPGYGELINATPRFHQGSAG
jgi:hypothetical protein